MSSIPVQRSIFATELAAILASHGYTVEGLRRAPFTFDKQKVERLEASQRSLMYLPALSHGELMSIVLLLKLHEDERLRLYAALIALGTQRLLLDYLPPQRAWEIACEVRDAALTWLRDHGTDDDLLRRRSLREINGMDINANLHATSDDMLLTEAMTSYDEGIAAAALGLFMGETAMGRHHLERAAFLLERTKTLLQNLSPNASTSDVGTYWARETLKALAEVRAELG